MLPKVFYDPRSLDLDAQKRACLHAKCIVVDGEAVFISSANFTEAAQERNAEVGLLVRSCWLAERLVLHFNMLLAGNLVVPVL
jgi:phosphatidylserine/phosphatidylglycerophosphate/cardiolipin synthase-like enzyme